MAASPHPRTRPGIGRPAPDTPAPPLQRVITMTCLGFVAIRAAAVLYGGGTARVWGLDAAASLLSRPDIVLALLLPLAALHPSVAAWWSGRIARRAPPRPAAAVALTAAAVAAAVAVAATVHIPFPALGDAPYYLGDTYRVMHQSGTVTGLVKPMAWLSGHLLLAVIDLFDVREVSTPFVAAGVTGAAVTAAALGWGFRRERPRIAIPLTLAVLGAPGMLLFLGYLELYTIGYALTIAAALALWNALRHGTHPAVPGVLLAAAMAFLLPSVVFVPAWLVVVARRLHGRIPWLDPVRAALVLSVLAVVAFLGLAVFTDTTQRAAPLLPLLPSALVDADGSAIGVQRYALFSAAHLLDIVNLFALHGGVLFPAAAAAVLAGWRAIDRRDPALAAFGAATVAALPIVLAGQSYFGLARDWDVSATPMLAPLMLTLALLVQLDATKRIDLTRLTPLLALVLLTSQLLWLRPNLDAEASAERFSDLVRQNAGLLIPRETFVALEHLRKYHQGRGDAPAERAVLRAMAETGHLPLSSYRRMLVMVLRGRGEVREDLTWLFDRLAGEFRSGTTDGAAPDPRQYGGDARDLDELATRAVIGAWQAGEAELARESAARLAAIRPSWTGAGLLRAVSDPSLPSDTAIALLSAAVDSDTRDAELLVLAAGPAQRHGRTDAAIAMLERALELQPVHYPRWYLALAGMLRAEGAAPARTRSVLEACIARCAGTPEADEARRILETEF